MKERDRTITERIARVDWLKAKRKASEEARENLRSRNVSRAEKKSRPFSLSLDNGRRSL